MSDQNNTDIKDIATTSGVVSDTTSAAQSASTSIDSATGATYDSDSSIDSKAGTETSGYYIDEEFSDSQGLIAGDLSNLFRTDSKDRISSTPVGSPIRSNISVRQLAQRFDVNSNISRCISESNIHLRVTRSSGLKPEYDG